MKHRCWQGAEYQLKLIIVNWLIRYQHVYSMHGCPDSNQRMGCSNHHHNHNPEFDQVKVKVKFISTCGGHAQNFSVCRVSKHGRCYVWSWLIELSSVVPYCFTFLARLFRGSITHRTRIIVKGPGWGKLWIGLMEGIGLAPFCKLETVSHKAPVVSFRHPHSLSLHLSLCLSLPTSRCHRKGAFVCLQKTPQYEVTGSK